MDDDFKDELELLINALLSPDKLVVKQINGKSLKASEYLAYVEHFFKLFQTDSLPLTQTIYEATVEKQLDLKLDLNEEQVRKRLAELESTLQLAQERINVLTELLEESEKRRREELAFRRSIEAAMDNLTQRIRDQC
jgi:ABC-type antimicrobial peptide transport system ATPase subunit